MYIWYVLINDIHKYDPMQGQGQDYKWLKCVKMADFNIYLLCQYARNKNTNGELWCSQDSM